MDEVSLGRSVAGAREAAGMTQDGLGRAVGLDRSAISRLEKGERRINVPEMVRIAEALKRPLSFFVSDPVEAVVSRRSDSVHAHASTRQLDVQLAQFASDLRFLLRRGLIAAPRRLHLQVPLDHVAAEAAAQMTREHLSLGSEPIADLGRTSEMLGLYVSSASLGTGGADGGCVEVEESAVVIGATVLNGDTPAGRRRMTLAHELGHWLFGDAYDSEASLNSEKMINSFAVHLLAPRAGVQSVWNAYREAPLRDRALAVGAIYRLSWSATVSQLRNVNLITHDDHRSLSAQEPKSSEYLRLGLTWSEEFSAPYVSPLLTAAILTSYVAEKLTANRTVELLRGALADEGLPQRPAFEREDLRDQFDGHDFER